MSWGAPGARPQYSGYGQPQSGGYNPSAPPGGGGYGAPPQYQQQQQPAQGYGQPPPQYGGGGYQQQGGYQQTPQGAGGYQQPGYGGYGAPPSQGYGGGPGGPPGGYGPPPPPGVSQDVWNMFQAVDQDRSGQITANELQYALMNGNWSPFNSETCRLMIGMFDRNKDGTIDAQEFAALWKYIQDWKSCFERFDTDRSGNIDARELHTAFQTFGYNLSPQFCDTVVRVFDRRGSRNINFDDFIQTCVMLKTLTDKFRVKDTQQRGVINISYEDFLEMVLDNTIMNVR
ncbi:programmed cell death protein 6-like isoform X2 [Ostrea edulis]|uniref:programmed cell death protein 6-like isoform X2 n=1 Tax=Ostrea edulis TaxID=37623 RepID=UPI0020964657|nr:programmed cell death protein 6-like isoform X2 [Ostrea edulis]